MKEEIQNVPEQEQQMHKNHIALLLEGIVLLITGLILILAPKAGMGLVAAGLGALIASDGIHRTITTFKSLDTTLFLKIISIIEMALGVIILCFAFIIGKNLAIILIFILGIILIAVAILHFIEFIRSKKEGKRFPVYALFTLSMGILMVIIPKVASQLLLRLLGIIPVLIGIISIRLAFSKRNSIIQ